MASVELLLTDTLRPAGPLLTLAVVLLCGMLGGALARKLRLPGITGQILVGVLIGKAGFELFSDEGLHALHPLTQFALGLMSVTVGAHLNLKRLRNAGHRLFVLFLFEATFTPLLVFAGLVTIGRVDVRLAVLFATAAIATAPATVIAVVAEARAKGVFVKTLVAAVALNNMACIILFEVARVFAGNLLGEGDMGEALSGPARQLLYAILIGGALAAAMELVSRYVVQPERVATAAMLALVLCSGLASFFGVSSLLACLFLGFVQTNVSRARDHLVDTVFENFQPAILAVFFTLAGMHLSFEHAAVTGGISALVFGLRAIGKYFSASWAMRIAHAPLKVQRNLGWGLIPQAGVAVALVILLQDDARFDEISGIFGAVVLTVVTINELIGPFTLRHGLNSAGESNMDRTRLIDFIQEENIATDFSARDKHQAIEKLVDLLISSHHLKEIDRRYILESVLQRESQASTCLGGGLSVPHGILPSGQPMVGVMAISREGLDFPTPDGRPVHCMVLLGTSPEERDRHLQVLTTLARSIGSDKDFQTRLINAKNAAHASELLHGEESVHFNYFLETED